MSNNNNNPIRRIKAIETMYGNTLFRSRLEARWAVLFDELGVEWLYEYEAFNLSDGSNYLPDFYFPKWNLYAEIKPTKEFKDSRWLVFGTDIEDSPGLIILTGKPKIKQCELYCEYGWTDECVAIFQGKYAPIYYGSLDQKYIYSGTNVEQAEIKANSYRFGY